MSYQIFIRTIYLCWIGIMESCTAFELEDPQAGALLECRKHTYVLASHGTDAVHVPNSHRQVHQNMLQHTSASVIPLVREVLDGGDFWSWHDHGHPELLP